MSIYSDGSIPGLSANDFGSLIQEAGKSQGQVHNQRFNDMMAMAQDYQNAKTDEERLDVLNRMRAYEEDGK